MTWNACYRYYLQQLQPVYGLEEAAAITGIIFENKCGIKKFDIIGHPETELPAADTSVLEAALQQLLQHKPVQYITGETWFYHLKFSVDEQVLIPRPETEELVQWIIDDHVNSTKPLRVLDIGTGSGCIAVALKKNQPAFTITAIDVSPGALHTARKNAAGNDTPIDFFTVDFLDEHARKGLPAFDIIVSNPPYIPLHEKEKMDTHVTAYEPQQALFVPGDAPLLFYKAIALFAETHLEKNGRIYLETHQSYAEATAGIFLEKYLHTVVKKDISGNNRMVRVTNFLP
jgi:release factor glutamine methyltransferase